MPDREKVIKGLQIEREYVSRDCDRNCGKCDLVQDRDWLLSVYDDALELLKDYKVLEKQHEISNELLKLNRRTGKWIEEEPNSYTKKTYCSVCKESAPFIAVEGDYYGRNMHGKTEKTKYCPNCGARMTL